MWLVIRAVVSLVVRAVLVSAVAAGLAALVALVVSGDFHKRLQLTLGLGAGMLLVFAATGSSPSMDRAIGQRTRMIVGPMIGRDDERFTGPRPSTSAVFVLAAVIMVAASVLLDV